MNLLLLEEADFVSQGRAVVGGRRAAHVRNVLRAVPGDSITVGVVNGNSGRATVHRVDDTCELVIENLGEAPPPKLPLILVLALPRPKVFNRVIAAAASLGVEQIELINTWRVEKSYWSSPRLAEANIREQLIAGLEQAKDTRLPHVRIHRLLMPFIRERLPELRGELRLIAHPGGVPAPRDGCSGAILAVGPEGGFIEREVATFEAAGFSRVALGERILRVETAVPCLIGRMY